jgi:hypothetical protein
MKLSESIYKDEDDALSASSRGFATHTVLSQPGPMSATRPKSHNHSVIRTLKRLVFSLPKVYKDFLIGFSEFRD